MAMFNAFASKKDYASLSRNGVRGSSVHFSAIIRLSRETRGDGLVYLAFAASKKIIPRAVDRNKVKRRLRFALKLSLDSFDVSDFYSLYILLIPKKGALTVDFTVLLQDLKKILKYAKNQQNPS